METTFKYAYEAMKLVSANDIEGLVVLSKGAPYGIAKSHFYFGVRSRDYRLFFVAFLDTVKYAFAGSYTSELKEGWRHVCSCILKPIVRYSIAMEMLYDPNGASAFHVPSYNSINVTSYSSSELYSASTSDVMMSDIPKMGLMYSETFNHDAEVYNTSERLKHIRNSQSEDIANCWSDNGSGKNLDENAFLKLEQGDAVINSRDEEVMNS